MSESSYTLPLAGAVITMSGPFPVTDLQWQQMQEVLSAMRPGLVADEPALSYSSQLLPTPSPRHQDQSNWDSGLDLPPGGSDNGVRV